MHWGVEGSDGAGWLARTLPSTCEVCVGWLREPWRWGIQQGLCDLWPRSLSLPAQWVLCPLTSAAGAPLGPGCLAQAFGPTCTVDARFVMPGGSRSRGPWGRLGWNFHPDCVVGAGFGSPRAQMSSGAQAAWPRSPGPPARWVPGPGTPGVGLRQVLGLVAWPGSLDPPAWWALVL